MRFMSGVLIAALLSAGCYRESHHLPTDPGVLQALTLTSSPQSIAADGFSRTTITATIDPGSASDKRSITFTTTLGSFVGATQASPASLAVTASPDGVATVELRSVATVDTAVVTATVTGTGVTRSINIPFTSPSPASIITISLSRNDVPADGQTVIQVRADVAPSIPTGSRTVTFTASQPKFVATSNQTDTATADVTNRAVVNYQVPTTLTDVRLTASVANATAETTLHLVAALPDAIALEAPASAVKAGDDITVTARLQRTIGTPTAGRVVSFTAVDDAGHPVGGLRNVKLSDGTGVASAVFNPSGTSYRGLVTIRATTVSASGPTISSEIMLKVNDA